MNESIIHFLQTQTCASVCLLDDKGMPYCFTCFYAFDPELGLLYFKSSPDSYHSGLLIHNSAVAGTILPDKLNSLLIKGVQFEGTVVTDNLAENAYLYYHKRRPLALTISGSMFTIRLKHIKLTDGGKGIGRKIHWSRED